ncbi:hypothetical protein IG631_16747 [Alternaria alternata]|nr:hypothetical protein IG631_16747 [Alternaria alternata]
MGWWWRVEKGLIVMFTTVNSELFLAPDDDYIAILPSGKGQPLLGVRLDGEVRVAHNTERSAAYGCARSYAL